MYSRRKSWSHIALILSLGSSTNVAVPSACEANVQLLRRANPWEGRSPAQYANTHIVNTCVHNKSWRCDRRTSAKLGKH